MKEGTGKESKNAEEKPREQLMIEVEELRSRITAFERAESAKGSDNDGERFRGLFTTMSSGVAVYEAVDNGEDFIFRDFNPAAERIESMNREDIIGKRLTEVFPGVKDFGIFRVFQRE